MELSRLSTLAWKHTRNAVAEEAYLHTGYDGTKPVTFYGLVNERCNVKCRYCEYWRLKHYVPEMTIDEWKIGSHQHQGICRQLFNQLQRRRAIYQARLYRSSCVVQQQ